MPSSSSSDRELLQVLDACLASTAAALHDRPVQQLVAAKLMIETVLATDQRDDMVGRAVEVIGTAGQQTRDLMWLLTAPVLRADALAEDARDALARGGDPDRLRRTTVSLDDDVDADDVRCVVRSVHHVLAAAHLAGVDPSAVRVSSDAEAVEGVVVLEADVGGSAWSRLAAARAGVAGGTLAVDDDADDGHRVTVRVPRHS